MKPSSERLRRAERLQTLVERMRVEPNLNPARLAEELRVSERTIFRDMRDLTENEALRKRYSRREGRYLMESEPTTPPLSFSPMEAHALLLAASDAALTETALAESLRPALDKLRAALTSSEDGSAAVPIGMNPDHHRQHFIERLRRAMRSNRKVHVRYWDGQANLARDLALTPYDLRLLENHWVLTANCDEAGGVCRFLLRRMFDVEVLNDRFRFPRHFSADLFFERATEPFGDNQDT